MVPSVEPLDIPIAFVPRHNGREDTPRKHFQHPAKDRSLIAHAGLHFLSLDNQKVASKGLRRLACTCDTVNHPPDSPARKRESSASDSGCNPWVPAFAGRREDWVHLKWE